MSTIISASSYFQCVLRGHAAIFWLHDTIIRGVQQLRAGGASMLRGGAMASHAREHNKQQQISTLYLGKDYDYVCKQRGCWDTGAGFKWGRCFLLKRIILCSHLEKQKYSMAKN